MTSLRKRKKTANALGLTEAELTLAELLDEVLAELRWVRILAYGNQYLLNRHVKVDPAERDKVIEAATRAVEEDGRLHEWQERLAQVRGAAATAKRAMSRAWRDTLAGPQAGESSRDATIREAGGPQPMERSRPEGVVAAATTRQPPVAASTAMARQERGAAVAGEGERDG